MIDKKLKISIDSIVNSIKLLLYKEDEFLFNKLNFDDDNTFLEPLLFTYFNGKTHESFSKEILEEFMQGYFINKNTVKIKYLYNTNGIAYLPKIGYFKGSPPTQIDQLHIVNDSKIELLKDNCELLNSVLKTDKKDCKSNGINLSLAISEKNIFFLTNSLQYIKYSSPEYYNLMDICCKKMVLFKADPNYINSFATINAHGIAFFNVYQENYDEVFFVDDIAHQTGHIILTTLLFERNKFFLIDENKNIGIITNIDKEYRSFYILFHALFTYYTSLLCLNKCIENKCFNLSQTHEAKGRIGFYLKKLMSDMDSFKKVIDFYNGIEFVLTNDGIEIYHMMKITFTEMITKWYSISKKYDYKNQPYNFTYQEFIKLNPINNA